MFYSQFQKSILKLCILLAATLICQVLAYADRDSGKGNWDDKEKHGWDNYDKDRGRDRNVPVVPETNTGWVLIPVFGAVLVFSARQLFRAKA
jgi:hypothetical protein